MLTSTFRLCIFFVVYMELGFGVVYGDDDKLVLDIKAPTPKPGNYKPPSTPVKIGQYAPDTLKKTEAQVAEIAKLLSKETAVKGSANHFLEMAKRPAVKLEELKPEEPLTLLEDTTTPDDTTSTPPVAPNTDKAPATTPATPPATTPATAAKGTTPASPGPSKPAVDPSKKHDNGSKLVRLARRDIYSAKSPFFKRKKIYYSPSFAYYMLGEIGEGSYGVVWKASRAPKAGGVEKVLKKGGGTLVAVKSTAALAERDDKTRYTTNEATKMGQEVRLYNAIIKTDNTCSEYMVNYFEYFRHVKDLDNPVEYAVSGLSMELAGYGSLQDFVNKEFLLARTAAPQIMLAILRGVACLHQVSYAHRDLKPGNVLVRRLDNGDPQAVISDLGLAAPNDKHPNSWGTRSYAAPEYWYRSGGDVHPPAADLFSVGCIFYYLLTGEHPPRVQEAYEDDLGNKKIKYGHVEFDAKIFESIGVGTLEADFLQRLCWYDPAERLTMIQALQHPYVNPAVSFGDFIAAVPLPQVNPLGLDFIKYVPDTKPDPTNYIKRRVLAANMKETFGI